MASKKIIAVIIIMRATPFWLLRIFFNSLLIFKIFTIIKYLVIAGLIASVVGTSISTCSSATSSGASSRCRLDNRSNQWPVSSKDFNQFPFISTLIIPGDIHFHTANKILSILDTSEIGFPFPFFKIPELKLEIFNILQKDRTLYFFDVLNIKTVIIPYV